MEPAFALCTVTLYAFVVLPLISGVMITVDSFFAWMVSRASSPVYVTSPTVAETESAESKLIGYTCMDGTNPFFKTLENAIREVVEANGDKLISFDPQNDSETQNAQIEEMISHGIDALFVNPVDKDNIAETLAKVKAAGIPMFGFDTEPTDSSCLETYVGSDNYNAGFVCGLDLCEKLPEGGPIIILDSPMTQSIVDRTNGFLDAIKDKNFEVVAQLDAKANQEQGSIKCLDALTEHPEALCIFCGNDPTALGALSSANSAYSSALIYGIDGSPEIKALIAEGKITGTGAQSPTNIGKTVAELFYKWSAGEKIESYYTIDTFIINSDNVDEYNNGDWQ